MTPLRAISLFSGVGGLDLGLHNAGIEPVIFCESDAWKRTILAHHWPEVPIHDDIRTLAPHDGDAPHAPATGEQQPVGPSLRGLAGRIDIVHGGFPCQDVSVAGRRAGLAGNRTGLYWDALRVIDAVQPRAVLLENVPGLLSSNGGRDFGVVVGELADRGYGLAYRVLDAQHFGVPQRRRRVFVLALAGDDSRACAERAGQVLALCEGLRWDLAPSDEARASVAARARGGAGGGVVGTLAGTGPGGGWRIGADEAAAGHLVPVLANTLKGQLGKGGGGIGPEETLIPVASHVIAPTLTGSGGGQAQNADASQQAYAISPVGVRRLTPVECERLMGWPEVLDLEGDDDDHIRRAIQGCREEAGAAIHPSDPLFLLWVYGEAGAASPEHHAGAGRSRRALHLVSSARALGGRVGSEARPGSDVHRVRFHVPTEAAQALAHLLGPGLLDRDGTAIGPEALGCRARMTGWTAPPGVKAPDARRYAGCGDGVASPVAEWIGYGLAMVLREGRDDG